MINDNIFNRDYDKASYLYLIGIVLLSFGSVISLIYELYALSLILFLIPFIVFSFFQFQKYFVEIFLITLFVGVYFQWSLRVQLSLISAYALIFFYLASGGNSIFNDLKVPGRIRNSAAFLIGAVLLSSIATPFLSFFSIYYAYLFFIFMFTSYVIFRSVKNADAIDKILYFFVLLNAISGIIIILQIIYTGNLRSLGPALFPQMDFAAMALITILFRNFLLSKTNKKSIFVTAIVFVILITTQSRFAWLGFLLTLIYGLIICFIFSSDARVIIRKRLPVLVFSLLIGLSLVFIFGLENIFFNRLGSSNFTLFQGSEEGALTTNSLESRVFIWIVAGNTFLQHPLTGVGYFMFPDVSRNFNILPEYIYNIFVEGLDAHTTYLNFLCETGIIGFTSFVIYLVSIFLLTLKSIRLSATLLNLKVSIILNLLVFFIMIHSVYSGAFTMGQNAFHMHFIFGLAVANYVFIARSKEQNTRSNT